MSKRIYRSEVPAEDLEQYGIDGGYYPVHLGYILSSGRYKILHKLGFGAFSTVWLARDLQEQRYDSIKISVSEISQEANKEKLVLEHLERTKAVDHPGYHYIPRMLDSFSITPMSKKNTLESPDASKHICFVSDVLGPNVSCVVEEMPGRRLNPVLARAVSKQLLLAVDYLHQAGIAHGDIHMGNLLFTIPGFGDCDLTPEQVINRFGKPSIGAVTRVDGGDIGSEVPRYVVEPVVFTDADMKAMCEVKLVDYGSSFFLNAPPNDLPTPISLKPPEVLYGLGIGEKADIWSLGCTTYELVTGRVLFNVMTISQLEEEWKDLIGEFKVESSDEGQKSITVTAPSEELAAEIAENCDNDELSEDLALDQTQITLLVTVLKKMLKMDPRERATTEELLRDPWFANIT